ncbi:MAG: hypothetical protein HY332_25185 [Chloroflexi bacterium]|nr:hypothetical protein [Chloroflexota bacterium]
MAPVDLNSLRAGFAGRRYAELIQHHIRRQGTAQLYSAVNGTVDLLPPAARVLAEGFIDRWNTRVYDAAFWRSDCSDVFDQIIEE